ncbi:glycosyltransferase family 4 protein [Rhizorhapis sp. SPR117]|uniref:glycosyltransferase family 4 protein n=1 Tax=Rhizorhapis sp. SPR117 TaxID=2912611 RepID=UPI001F366213|nr:glycosyltransferase family 4 protein [Rhizorhapis sp. SPR117]
MGEDASIVNVAFPSNEFERAKPTLHWASEAVINRDRHGRHWSAHPLHLSHLAEIRSHFDHLRLVLRVEERDPPVETVTWIVDHDVSVEPLPGYKGVGGFIKALPALVQRLNRAAVKADALSVRLPGPIGSLHAFFCWLRGIPYTVHMVGDPHQVLSSKGFRWYERLMRWPLVAVSRFICSRAVACAYVTERQLQLLYPPGKGAPSVAISNVLLEPRHFVDRPRLGPLKNRASLAFCGSLAQEYKGLDILLEAVYQLTSAGLDIHLVVMGDGVFRAKYETQALRLGLIERVRFCGNVPPETVLVQFRSCDLFVMPSRTEGLPRAMIEAMAQALPCIGTNVGGIPELLDDAALVPSDDVSALAARIERFLRDEQLFAAQSARNLDRAKYFETSLIAERRHSFYGWLSRAAVKRKTI